MHKTDPHPSWPYLRPIRWLITALVKTILRTKSTFSQEANWSLREGKTLLVCNHVSYLDGVLVALCSPAPLAVGVDLDWSVRNRGSRVGMKLMEVLGYGWVVPVDGNSPAGIRQLARHLNAGNSVLLFPEGQISADGQPLPWQAGWRWLVQKTGAQVVFGTIHGAHESKWFSKSGRKAWPRIELTVESAT